MLVLSSLQQEQISAHGERDYPYECCGLLLGRFGPNGDKLCQGTLAISNAREEAAKRNRFLIRPEELLHGEHVAAANGQEVIGFYHSHPDHPAVPSDYDREHAWPTYSYVVVAVASGRAGDLRSWELQANRSRFDEEIISI